jgi:hypothetical protein
MRGFVRKTLAELVKPKVTIAAANNEGTPALSTSGTNPNQVPRPQGNRRARRRQMVTLQRVQKRLAGQGIKMEMGPVGQRDTKPENMLRGKTPASTFIDDAEKVIGVDYSSGPSRSETIIAQVNENGQILALVPDDEVEAYLATHPGAKVQPRDGG